MKRHHYFAAIASTLVLDMVYFYAIDPRTTNSLGLALGFIMLSATIVMFGILAAQLWSRVLFPDTPLRATLRVTCAISGVLVFLLGLQSIGQLTFQDIVMLTPFALVLLFYTGYGKRFRITQT